MAIVMSGTASNGAKWRIHDDAYIHKTPEQLEAQRRLACNIAYGILVEYAKKNGCGADGENRSGDLSGES